MDNAMVRERCEDLRLKWLEDASSGDSMIDLVVQVYRAAYVDGLEAAAKIGEGVADLLYSSSPSHRKGCMTVFEAIRQYAKEMGHE